MSSSEPANIIETKQKIVGIFSRSASTYDQIGPRFFSHFGHRLVNLAKIPSGAQVLDVAIGRGAVLFPAIEAVGPHGHVTGIDLSNAMVQETAEEIYRLKLSNVTVRQMDAEYLQFPDASFDCILCGFAVFFFPQLNRALSEMLRVLRPNGRIAITTWDKSLGELWKWFDDLVNQYLPPEDETQQISEAKSAPPEFDTPEGLQVIMQSAGFTDVQITSETYEVIYTTEQEWWSSLWSHGIREALENIESATGSDGLKSFKAAVFERIQAIRLADGIHQLWPTIFTLAIKPPE